jgi:hypothetical protein
LKWKTKSKLDLGVFPGRRLRKASKASGSTWQGTRTVGCSRRKGSATHRRRWSTRMGSLSLVVIGRHRLRVEPMQLRDEREDEADRASRRSEGRGPHVKRQERIDLRSPVRLTDAEAFAGVEPVTLGERALLDDAPAGWRASNEASSESGAIERRTRSIVARRIAGGVRPVGVPSYSVKPQSPSGHHVAVSAREGAAHGGA